MDTAPPLLDASAAFYLADPRLSASSNFSCVFDQVHNITVHIPKGSHELCLANATIREPCSQTITSDIIRVCPLVQQYRSLPAQLSENRLSSRLRRALAGKHVAVLGDSMSRQVWHVGVGRLRDEQVLLDPKMWSVMRYRLRTTHGPLLADCLEVLLDPLDPHYRDPCAGFNSNVSSANITTLAWVPMPLWSSAKLAIRSITSMEAASGQRFSTFLIMVPSLWQLDRPEPTLPNGVFDVPSYFWRLWDAYAELRRETARYAAVTQPIQALGCSNQHEGWQTHNYMLARLHNVTAASPLCQTPPHAFPHATNTHPQCCRLGAIAAINRLAALPKGWLKVDFDGLVADAIAARGVKAVPTMQKGNWHYECYLSGELSSFGHAGKHVAQAYRSSCKGVQGPHDRCLNFYKSYFATQRDVTYDPIDTGDCTEVGNTMLWEHLITSSALGNELF